MTKLEAKALGIEMWEYLAKHPEIKRKGDLPAYLYSKIVSLFNFCPLCELFIKDNPRLICSLCPLKDCFDIESAYQRYNWGRTDEARRAAAQEIVDKIKAWEVEE